MFYFAYVLAPVRVGKNTFYPQFSHFAKLPSARVFHREKAFKCIKDALKCTSFKLAIRYIRTHMRFIIEEPFVGVRAHTTESKMYPKMTFDFGRTYVLNNKK